MANKEKTNKNTHDEIDQALLAWEVLEYPTYERGIWWYTILVVAVAGLLALSFFTPNFIFEKPNYLFMIVIILAVVGLLINNESDQIVEVVVTMEGIEVGDKFYDYDSFEKFSILFKPREDVKVLYLEFNNPFRPRIGISLEDQDPVELRNILNKYIDEDLDRTDESNSDFISKKLKI